MVDRTLAHVHSFGVHVIVAMEHHAVRAVGVCNQTSFLSRMVVQQPELRNRT